MVLGSLCIHVAKSSMLLYRILQSKNLVFYLMDLCFSSFVLVSVCFFGEGEMFVLCLCS